VLKHGFIDRIIRRDQLAAELASLIALLAPSESENRLSPHG
jgi:acetyl-CoA carboxylase beta subunit